MLQQFLLLVGGLRAMAAGEHGQARCSTPICCAPWRSRGTPRRSTTACAAAEGPHRWFHLAAGGVLCADCRLPGAATPAPETLAVLGALLAGDWPTVHAAEPRHLREASGLVAAYLSWHLEREVKSLAHVQALIVGRLVLGCVL